MTSTGPNWQWMSLSVSQMQLFLEQLLADIWVSGLQGSTFEQVEDYISTLWLQGTFYNFYPFEIQFFSIVFFFLFFSFFFCDLCDYTAVLRILQARTLEWVAISFSNAGKWKMKVKLLQSCLTLTDPMDCSLSGSSIHGIFQARVLEWVAIAFSECIVVFTKTNLLTHCLVYRGKKNGFSPVFKEIVSLILQKII